MVVYGEEWNRGACLSKKDRSRRPRLRITKRNRDEEIRQQNLVYILSLYAIIFSLHSILKAPLANELPRDCDKENLPILLLQLLHQRIVDLGVHWGENTLVGDRAIKYLFDGWMTQHVSNSSFQKSMALRHCSRLRAIKGETSGGSAPPQRERGDLPTPHGTPTNFAIAE